MNKYKQIEFVLNFDQTHWTCHTNKHSFSGTSLEQIDAQVESYIQKKFPEQNVKVFMHFDFGHFPTWMRQYMAHYFNRELIFEQKNI